MKHATFIHVPKTGGTSVFSTLWLAEQQHKNFHLWRGHETGLCRIEKLTAILGESVAMNFWHESFRFSFVRNPWDRHVSCYHAFGDTDQLSFEDWILSGSLIRHDFSLLFTGDIRPDILNQSSFLLDRDGNDMTDFIGRFENLQEDFDTVCSIMNILSTDVGHLNRSEDRDYRTYYTSNETKDLVAAKDRWVIDRFGYTF